MAEFSLHGLKEANQFLNTQEKKHADMATQLEGAINNLDKKITEYLVLLSEKPLSPYRL